jgi:glucan 1,3-beta-glucosidase
MEFLNCGTGIDTDGAGSLTVLDSTAHSVGRVIATGESGSSAGSLVIDNLSATSVWSIIQNYHDNRNILPGTESSVTVDTWAQGNIYLGLDDSRYMQRTLSTPFKPPGMLDQGGRFFTRTRPVYQDSKVGDIVNVKDCGARGDGHSDDTAILNSILLENAKAEQITYFLHGYYVVTDTIYVPPNSRIIGEVWSAINGTYDPFVFLCKFGPHLTNRFFQLGATISQIRKTHARSSKSGNQARLGLPRFPT